MLGDATQAFDNQKLCELLRSAKSWDETISAKRYVLSYFAHCLLLKGILMWDPSIRNFHHYEERKVKHMINEQIVFGSGKENSVFNIWNWFYHQNKVFHKIDVNPSKPRVYVHESGQKYINIFTGYLYPNPPPHDSYDNNVKSCVATILRHIQMVLCSDKKDQTEYIFGWLSNMINGRKMNTALFLHSGQGTGKSTITTFIRHKVIGLPITHKSTNEKVITRSFNKELEGKVLLVLEEMSGSKTGDWIAFANRLKDFIDGDQLLIEEKGKTPYSVTNITSLIINSNNSKAVRLDKDDRRYFIPEISDKYVGNLDYFNKLLSAVNYPKVGEAFYSYMCNYTKTHTFDERKIPKTCTKQMMVSEATHNIHIFIKE